MNPAARGGLPRVALALSLVACLGLAGGCRRDRGGEAPGGDPADPGAAGAEEPAGPERGDTLVVAYPADADVLNPVVSRSDLSGQILDFLYPLLVIPTFECRCRYQPHLAERWSFSDDGTALTFQLRDDVAWSDGEPVDADDVVFSLALMRDPAVGSSAASGLRHLRAADPVERVDDHTVTVHFDHAYDRDTMLAHAGGYALVPEHVLRDWPRDQLRGAPQSTAPVTAGLFRVARWERDQELVLERDEAPAPFAPAYLDRVIFRVIPEYSTRLLELKAGRVDLMPGLRIEDVAALRRDHPEIAVHRRGRRFTDYLAWNLADERFADARVRQALAHAVDVETLIAALLTSGDEVFGERAVGTITPALCATRNEAIEPVTHDPERARALFAEAGWIDTDGDGWLDRDGRRLAFTLETNAGNTRREQAQVILQEQLRRAGVDVRLATVEGNAFFEKLRAHDFEAALTGWSASLFVDPTPLWKTGAAYNYGGYSSARVDELIDRGLATTDPDEAARCWQELQAAIHADQPVCFLYWRDELVAVDGRFRDVRIDTLWLFGNLGQWWVPAAEQRYPR